MGQILKETERNPGGRPAKTSTHRELVLPPAVADLGLSKKESSRAQLLADLPDELSKREMRDRARKGRAAGGDATPEQIKERLSAAAADKRSTKPKQDSRKAAAKAAGGLCDPLPAGPGGT